MVKEYPTGIGNPSCRMAPNGQKRHAIHLDFGYSLYIMSLRLSIANIVSNFGLNARLAPKAWCSAASDCWGTTATPLPLWLVGGALDYSAGEAISSVQNFGKMNAISDGCGSYHRKLIMLYDIQLRAVVFNEIHCHFQQPPVASLSGYLCMRTSSQSTTSLSRGLCRCLLSSQCKV